MSKNDHSVGPGFSIAPIAGKTMSRFAASDLPQEILAGIGAVVAQWSYLTFQMTVILRLGFKLTKETQRAILVGAEVGVLCGQMRTLAGTDHWIKDQTIRDEIESLAEDIQKKSRARNDHAHGVFGYLVGKAGGPDEEKFVRFLMKSAEQRVTPLPEEITAQSLKDHTMVALRLWERAQALTQKMKGKA